MISISLAAELENLLGCQDSVSYLFVKILYFSFSELSARDNNSKLVQGPHNSAWNRVGA